MLYKILLPLFFLVSSLSSRSAEAPHSPSAGDFTTPSKDAYCLEMIRQFPSNPMIVENFIHFMLDHAHQCFQNQPKEKYYVYNLLIDWVQQIDTVQTQDAKLSIEEEISIYSHQKEFGNLSHLEQILSAVLQETMKKPFQMHFNKKINFIHTIVDSVLENITPPSQESFQAFEERINSLIDNSYLKIFKFEEKHMDDIFIQLKYAKWRQPIQTPPHIKKEKTIRLGYDFELTTITHKAHFDMLFCQKTDDFKIILQPLSLKIQNIMTELLSEHSYYDPALFQPVWDQFQQPFFSAEHIQDSMDLLKALPHHGSTAILLEFIEKWLNIKNKIDQSMDQHCLTPSWNDRKTPMTEVKMIYRFLKPDLSFEVKENLINQILKYHMDSAKYLHQSFIAQPNLLRFYIYEVK